MLRGNIKNGDVGRCWQKVGENRSVLFFDIEKEKTPQASSEIKECQ